MEGFAEISRLAGAGTPFLFIVSYDRRRVLVRPLEALGGMRCSLAENGHREAASSSPVALRKFPIPYRRYRQAFDAVIAEIEAGNTYLLNLTFPTPIKTPLGLEAIYERARAPFKLFVPGRFVCFSPEPFVTITDDTIATYPMKGTIDAAVENAEAKILADEKEMAEHVMVVDLLRNDLGMVGRHVRVKRFRYIQRIATHDKTLLQVSSEITARLPKDWRQNLGEILYTLLPAGSVTGTPKKRTCEIIERIEGYERGFFTGIFGVFDGKNLRSAVAIRFVEQTPEGLVYKSGGGITIDSDPKAEYREMIDKVYLPV
ncbi:aminodeoxychorismate synthase component I [Hydrogenimonas sp.]